MALLWREKIQVSKEMLTDVIWWSTDACSKKDWLELRLLSEARYNLCFTVNPQRDAPLHKKFENMTMSVTQRYIH